MSYGTITPTQLNERLQRGTSIVLIDVREPEERAIAHIEGADLLPLSRFNEWVGMINKCRIMNAE